MCTLYVVRTVWLNFYYIFHNLQTTAYAHNVEIIVENHLRFWKQKKIGRYADTTENCVNFQQKLDSSDITNEHKRQICFKEREKKKFTPTCCQPCINFELCTKTQELSFVLNIKRFSQWPPKYFKPKTLYNLRISYEMPFCIQRRMTYYCKCWLFWAFFLNGVGEAIKITKTIDLNWFNSWIEMI